MMPKAVADQQNRCLSALTPGVAGAGPFSDCARAVSCVINGAVEVATVLSSDSALTGRNNIHAIEFPGVGAFYQRVPVFTVAEIDQRIFSVAHSHLWQNTDPLSSVQCRQNHQQYHAGFFLNC